MPLNQDSFDALLDWLDPDRETAAKKYETIRAGLTRMFVSHGLADAEHYADEAIDRVAKRLPEIRAEYSGDPHRYFIGVARNLLREANRRKELATDLLPDCVSLKDIDTDLAHCLSRCLRALPREKLELIHDYHVYGGHEKIESHREMAAELGITVGALRTRAHHVRTALESCVYKCLEQNRNKSGGSDHNSNDTR